VELLPGASSALYGANVNGILFMTSQSPFTSQGIAIKFGQTSQKLRDKRLC
jgi:hypothetical protein